MECCGVLSFHTHNEDLTDTTDSQATDHVSDDDCSLVDQEAADSPSSCSSHSSEETEEIPLPEPLVRQNASSVLIICGYFIYLIYFLGFGTCGTLLSRCG